MMTSPISNENQPFFSIGIPTYNRYSTLIIAINSVLAQSFKDFELIIFDNASSDLTSNIPKEFNDSRLKFTQNKSNCGAFTNYMLCRNAARGNYFTWLSSDDYFNDLTYLENAYGVIQKSPEIGLISSGRQLIDRKTNTYKNIKKGRNRYFENLEPWILGSQHGQILNSSGVLMNAKYLTSATIGKDPGAGWGFDDLLYAKIVARGGAFELSTVSVTMAINVNDNLVSSYSPHEVLNSMRNTRRQFIELISNSVPSNIAPKLNDLVAQRYADHIMMRRFIKAEILNSDGTLLNAFRNLREINISTFQILCDPLAFIGLWAIILPYKIRLHLIRAIS